MITDTITELDFKPNDVKLQESLDQLFIDYPELADMEQFSVSTIDGENDWKASTGWATDLPFKASSYNKVVKALHGSYFEHIMTRVFPTSYRWRLWRTTPDGSLMPHRDNDFRIHIPVYTNEWCFMTLMDNPPEQSEFGIERNMSFYHLELGKSYMLNTFKKAHGVVNYGGGTRWHLVGSI